MVMRRFSKFCKKQEGGLVSKLGYKRYSPYREEPYLVIHSDTGNITMKEVDEPLLAISDVGEVAMMYPEREYKFKGKRIMEIPLRKKSKYSSGGLMNNVFNNEALASRMGYGNNITEDNADDVVDRYNKQMGIAQGVGHGIKAVGNVLNNFIPGAGIVGNIVGGVITHGAELVTNLVAGDKIKRAKDLRVYSRYAKQARKQEQDAKNVLHYV